MSWFGPYAPPTWDPQPQQMPMMWMPPPTQVQANPVINVYNQMGGGSNAPPALTLDMFRGLTGSGQMGGGGDSGFSVDTDTLAMMAMMAIPFAGKMGGAVKKGASAVNQGVRKGLGRLRGRKGRMVTTKMDTGKPVTTGSVPPAQLLTLDRFRGNVNKPLPPLPGINKPLPAVPSATAAASTTLPGKPIALNRTAPQAGMADFLPASQGLSQALNNLSSAARTGIKGGLPPIPSATLTSAGNWNRNAAYQQATGRMTKPLPDIPKALPPIPRTRQGGRGRSLRRPTRPVPPIPTSDKARGKRPAVPDKDDVDMTAYAAGRPLPPDLPEKPLGVPYLPAQGPSRLRERVPPRVPDKERPSVEETALMASAAYGKSPQSRRVSGWSYLEPYSDHNTAVYMRGNQIVTSHRGTAEAADLVTDAALAVGLGGLTPDARKAVAKRQQLGQIYPHAQFLDVGHSKGGFIANHVSRKVPGAQARTFNPGAGLDSPFTGNNRQSTYITGADPISIAATTGALGGARVHFVPPKSANTHAMKNFIPDTPLQRGRTTRQAVRDSVIAAAASQVAGLQRYGRRARNARDPDGLVERYASDGRTRPEDVDSRTWIMANRNMQEMLKRGLLDINDPYDRAWLRKNRKWSPYVPDTIETVT